MLAVIGGLAAPVMSHAAGTAVSTPVALEQADAVEVQSGGALRLEAQAPAAPPALGTYRRYGIAVSAVQSQRFLFRSLRIDYRASTPRGTAVLVDARVSGDGERWTEWATDLAPGATADFDVAARHAQFRVTLLGGDASPVVSAIQMTPLTGSAFFDMLEEQPQVAPTFRIRGTRQGMVGGRTANGHRITPRDRFVSLPCYCSLSTRGQDEYKVRITYNGRSTVVPVYDVGPWNRRDNYWVPQDQRHFGDLPQGWPQDHAAFYDGHNNGRSGLGWKVRFPTAIDIGDGAWWDDLGIRGDQAWVEVTFLWMGADPLAQPQPAPEPAPPPPAPEPPPGEPPLTPEEAQPQEEAPAPAEEAAPAEAPPEAAAPTAEAPPEAAAPAAAPPEAAAPAAEAPPEAAPAAEAPPEQAPAAATPQAVEALVTENDPGYKALAGTWYEAAGGCGEAGGASYTYTTTEPSNAENIAHWQPSLAAEGTYDVYVHVPACEHRKPTTSSARYVVHHRDGTAEVMVDQAASKGQWVLLGRFPFAAGDAGYVELRDLTGDQLYILWFDAVRWSPA